jgi:AcrR family transcriptional regulator
VTSPNPPRAPRRDATENREALLAAARLLLNRDPGASLESIAAEAGLSRRSVYSHFSNRDQLVLEVVTSGATRVAAALEAVPHPDPLTQLALIASRLWREVESVRVMAVVAVRGSLQAHTAAGLAPIRRDVRLAIKAGRANGTMRDDLDADRLARLVEDTALSVLEESTKHPLSSRDGNRLVMLLCLGVVGLGWRDAAALVDSTPELAWKDELSWKDSE